MAAALASTCAGIAATRGDAPGAGPRTRRDWPPSARADPTRRKNRSHLVSRRRAAPPPGEWRCRTRQRQAASPGRRPRAAGRSADDGTGMGVHGSGIAFGQVGHLLAIYGRLSAQAWRSIVLVVSLPPSESAAFVVDAYGPGQQMLCHAAFGTVQPFETRLRSSSACIVRNCTTFDLPGPA